MWQTWNTMPTWGHYLTRLVLVAAVLCVSACTTPLAPLGAFCVNAAV
jgi:hypothetical protein